MRTIQIQSIPSFNRTNNLLSISADSKTIKGEKFGYLTGILYLAPYKTIDKINTCAMADLAQCGFSCLYSAGRGAFNSVQQSRINKTKWFFYDRESFMHQLIRNILQLIVKANKKGLTPLIRLNGTSDIKWENVPFNYEGKSYSNIFELFPQIQFYDYTKIANRDNLPSNYDLTFSYSGAESFQPFVNKAIQKGMRIAAVYRNKNSIPDSQIINGQLMRVVNGDNSDIRHLDDSGVIVALYAKGKAKIDSGPFVIQN
jgi:hypothetical protein